VRTVLLIPVLLVCVALPVSASAREHRSASVKHEFQLTHPCPSTGLTSGACPGYVKDHIVPLACGGPMRSQTCNGRRSARRGPRTNGRRRAALGRGAIAAPSRSTPDIPGGGSRVRRLLAHLLPRPPAVAEASRQPQKDRDLAPRQYPVARGILNRPEDREASAK
jgi:hypothetical protein